MDRNCGLCPSKVDSLNLVYKVTLCSFIPVSMLAIVSMYSEHLHMFSDVVCLNHFIIQAEHCGANKSSED